MAFWMQPFLAGSTGLHEYSFRREGELFIVDQSHSALPGICKSLRRGGGRSSIPDSFREISDQFLLQTLFFRSIITSAAQQASHRHGATQLKRLLFPDSTWTPGEHHRHIQGDLSHCRTETKLLFNLFALEVSGYPSDHLFPTIQRSSTKRHARCSFRRGKRFIISLTLGRRKLETMMHFSLPFCSISGPGVNHVGRENTLVVSNEDNRSATAVLRHSFDFVVPSALNFSNPEYNSLKILFRYSTTTSRSWLSRKTPFLVSLLRNPSLLSYLRAYLDAITARLDLGPSLLRLIIFWTSFIEPWESLISGRCSWLYKLTWKLKSHRMLNLSLIYITGFLRES
jgi:hypothetical protein